VHAGDDVTRRCQRVIGSGGEWMFRSEAVRNGEERCVADAREVASETVVAVEGPEGEATTVEVDEERLPVIVNRFVVPSVEGSSRTGETAVTHRRHRSRWEFGEGAREHMCRSTVGNWRLSRARRWARSEVIEQRHEVRVNGWHESTLGTPPRLSRSADGDADTDGLLHIRREKASVLSSIIRMI